MKERRIYRGVAAVAILFAVCVLSGCMSLEGGSSSAASGSARSSTGSPVGVLFDWNSAANPVGANIPANTIVPSGYGTVNFGAYGAVSVAAQEGALNIANGRVLVIGSTQESLAGATGGSGIDPAHRPGQFDFSQGVFRLTIDYKDYAPAPDDPWLRILINNNTGGTGQSVLGNDSRLCHLRETLIADTSELGVVYLGEDARITLTFTPSIRYARADSAARNSLNNAFIAIRCNNTSVTVTGIKLERVE